MGFRCKDKKTNVFYDVTWIFRKNAWVPVVVVCRYNLYTKPIQRNLPDSIPDVTGLNLELENLGLIISWDNNSNYFAEVSTSTVTDEWTINVLEENQNTFVFDAYPYPGDTVQVRVRFTDGEDRFSENYATASISIWEMADFTLYGLTENVNNNYSEANTVYSINFGGEFYQDKLKTFTQENVEEENHKIFTYDGLIYRLVYRNRDSYQGYEFESINPVTLEVTPINLSTNELFNCTVTAMCFDSINQYAYVSTQCGFYRLELNGVVTVLSNSNNDIRAMEFYNGDLISLQDNNGNGPLNCYVTDRSNGARDEVELFSLTVDGHTFTQVFSLIAHNGYYYAVVYGSNESNYSGLFLLQILFGETGEVLTLETSVISQLTDPSRILGSIYPNEVPTLVIQQVYNDFSGLYHLSDEGVIGDLLIDTKVCCNIEEYQAFAFNPIDRHIYHTCMRIRDYDNQNEEIDPYDNLELIFEKLNPDTLEVTNIETSGLNYVRGVEFTTTSYIDDGGDDMFDDGNFLSTNRQDNGFIEYTHTPQTVSDFESFAQIADGTVEDGTNWFGSGSTYFTNMYEGLFVMVARDIDITKFTISGELGADGGGGASQETITLNNGHTGYFKKVHGAGDPSVNHLIIIPSKNGVVSNIVADTNQDYHSLENISGVDYIYYLLFSTSDGENNSVTTEQAQIIGNSFLETITGSGMTAENILARLNASVTNITENITDMFVFTDYNNGERSEFIGHQPGLFEPHCMTYQADNKFLVVSNGGLFSITTNGFVSAIGSGFHWQECRGLAFVGNRLFASFSSVDQIAEIDPNNGDIISQVNKKGWSVIVDAGENQLYTYAIRALAGNDEGLFISSYNDNETYTIAFISNLVPDENNILYATSLGEFRTSGGLTIEKFGRTAPPGQWFWSYNEDSTGIRVYDESLTELSAEELEVQWHEDNNADQSYTGWNDIAVEEVIQPDGGEGDNFVVVINKPSSNFKVRMRFNNPLSKWSYYEWD